MVFRSTAVTVTRYVFTKVYLRPVQGPTAPGIALTGGLFTFLPAFLSQHTLSSHHMYDPISFLFQSCRHPSPGFVPLTVAEFPARSRRPLLAGPAGRCGCGTPPQPPPRSLPAAGPQRGSSRLPTAFPPPPPALGAQGAVQLEGWGCKAVDSATVPQGGAAARGRTRGAGAWPEPTFEFPGRRVVAP